MLIMLHEVSPNALEFNNEILLNPEFIISIEKYDDNLHHYNKRNRPLSRIRIKGCGTIDVKETVEEINIKINLIKKQCSYKSDYSIGKYECEMCGIITEGVVDKSGIPLNNKCKDCKIRYRPYNRPIL